MGSSESTRKVTLEKDTDGIVKVSFSEILAK
jgi:hypothetical protein